MTKDPHTQGEVRTVSLVKILTMTLHRWRTVWVTTLAITAATLVFSLVRGPEYATVSEFMPQKKSAMPSQFASLASQFGINLPGMNEGESLDFYANLLRSRQLLEEMVLTEYRVEEDGQVRTATLVELWDIRGDTPAERVEKAVRKLNDRISVTTNPKAGVVELRTPAPWPEMAVQMNERALELVNRFNLEKRQSQARAEREFIDSRVREAKTELRRTESAMERFLDGNRRFQNSPQLTFEQARLQRDLDLHQKVYTSLLQMYEESRIEEVRNTPVITVVDPPALPVRPAGGGLVLHGILGLLLGGVVGVGFALVSEYRARYRTAFPEEYEEWERVKQGLLRRKG